MTEHEACDKIGCNQLASLVLKVYTTEGPHFICLCLLHSFDMTRIIDHMLSLMMGDTDDDPE